MRPWGWLLTWLGVVGFAASAYVNWKSGRETEALIAGLLNPLCFIGIPVGLYWLSRSGALRDFNESTTTARVFLTYCPC